MQADYRDKSYRSVSGQGPEERNPWFLARMLDSLAGWVVWD